MRVPLAFLALISEYLSPNQASFVPDRPSRTTPVYALASSNIEENIELNSNDDEKPMSIDEEYDVENISSDLPANNNNNNNFTEDNVVVLENVPLFPMTDKSVNQVIYSEWRLAHEFHMVPRFDVESKEQGLSMIKRRVYKYGRGGSTDFVEESWSGSGVERESAKVKELKSLLNRCCSRNSFSSYEDEYFYEERGCIPCGRFSDDFNEDLKRQLSRLRYSDFFRKGNKASIVFGSERLKSYHVGSEMNCIYKKNEEEGKYKFVTREQTNILVWYPKKNKPAELYHNDENLIRKVGNKLEIDMEVEGTAVYAASGVKSHTCLLAIKKQLERLKSNSKYSIYEQQHWIDGINECKNVNISAVQLESRWLSLGKKVGNNWKISSCSGIVRGNIFVDSGAKWNQIEKPFFSISGEGILSVDNGDGGFLAVFRNREAIRVLDSIALKKGDVVLSVKGQWGAERCYEEAIKSVGSSGLYPSRFFKDSCHASIVNVLTIE